MNNNIYKFRAWDKGYKKMYSPEEIEFIFNHSDEFEGEIKLFNNGRFYHFCGHYYRLESCIELMQYIGCKDINEKEVYEGDIVENVDSTQWKSKYQVIYIDAGWSVKEIVKDSSEVPYQTRLENFGKFNVIGNIFENKELL